MEEEAEELNNLKTELHELVSEVSSMYSQGDEEGAQALADANYEAVMEQVASGIVGVEQATMLQCLTEIYCGMGNSRAKVTLEQSANVLRQLKRQHGLLWDVLANTADQFLAMDQTLEAIDFYQLSLKAQDPENVPLKFRSETLIGLATAWGKKGDQVEARKSWEKLVDLWEEEEGSDSLMAARMMRQLGSYLMEIEMYDEAEDALGKALAIFRNQEGDHINKEIALTLLVAAHIEEVRGDVSIAAGVLQTAYNLLRESKDPLVPPGVPMFSGESSSQRDEELFQGIEEWLRRLQAEKIENWPAQLRELKGRVDEEETLERVDGKDSGGIKLALIDLADSSMKSENWNDAIPALRRLAGLMAENKQDKANMGYCLRDLAVCYQRVGDVEKAEETARDNVLLWEKVGGANVKEDQCDAYLLLASVLREKGKLEEVEMLLGRGLEILVQVLGPDHREVKGVAEQLKDVLKLRGREQVSNLVDMELTARGKKK